MIWKLAADIQQNPIPTASPSLPLSVSAAPFSSVVSGEAWLLRRCGSPRIDRPSPSAGCPRLPVQHPCSRQKCPSPEARG